MDIFSALKSQCLAAGFSEGISGFDEERFINLIFEKKI